MAEHDDTLIRIDAPHFCAGAIVRHRRVIEAAPIVAYMAGWTSARLVQYVRHKKWLGMFKTGSAAWLAFPDA